MSQTGTPTDIDLAASQYLYDAQNLAFDVVNDYPWTLSRSQEALQETPSVYLKEFVINEGVIQQQISFYTTALNNATEQDTAERGRGSSDPLSPYEGLYQGIPNGNWYKFPYFSEINFQIETPVWPTLDAIEQGKRAAIGVGGLLYGQTGARAAESLTNFVGNAYTASLATQYPKVGIMDRPRLWERHEFRTIEIKFPLFNTLGPNDWKANRKLCWILVNQNLFRKRDFITGVPPVYYEILIPGQHFSLAACVTNLVIYNRGNMRSLLDSNNVPVMVPDVYEVNITLTDMTMPSRNLFQAIYKKSQDVRVNFINSTTFKPAEQQSTISTLNNAFETVGRFTTNAGAATVQAGAEKVGGVLDFGRGVFNATLGGR